VTRTIRPPSDASPLAKSGHRTFHLVPSDLWNDQRAGGYYLPERFGEEGFIHCTDTIDEVIAVGNRYYSSDPRAYLLLEIDCERVAAPIVYEDAGRLFPHIYGPMETIAVRRVLPVVRDAEGRFLDISGDAV